jgi:hypothetical protein
VCQSLSHINETRYSVHDICSDLGGFAEARGAPHWMRDVEEGEVVVENIIEERKRPVNVRY